MAARIKCKLAIWTAAVLLSFMPHFSVAQPTLILDDALSNQQVFEIRQVVDDVAARYFQAFSYQFEPSTVMVFSADPSFLAREHSNRTGSSYAEKLQSFQTWINAEAGYRRVYVHVGKEQWQNRQDRKPMIAHEMFHILQHEFVGRRSQNCCRPDRVASLGPTWLHEGSANFYERVVTGRDMNGYLQYARQQVGNLRGRQLSILETRNDMNAVQSGYDIGAYAVSILVNDAGPSLVFSFYQGLGRGQRWERAFEEAFGLNPAAFYENFQ